MKIVKEPFLNYKNLYIYQDKDAFCYGIDAVLLGNFINITPAQKNILDLGTGNLPIPLILFSKYKKDIDCVEIQKEVYNLGKMTLKENHLEEKIHLFNEDIRSLDKKFNPNFYDVISINPPYFTNGKNSDKLLKVLSRHEVSITLDEILKMVSYLLNNKGHFYMIHRTERFLEIVSKLKSYNLTPKRVCFVHPNLGTKSKLFLIDCIKDGREGLTVEKPIIIYDGKQYRKEIKEMLGEVNDTEEL